MWNVVNENTDSSEEKLTGASSFCVIEDEDGSVLALPGEEELEREIVEKRPGLGRVYWFNRTAGYGFLREDGAQPKDYEGDSRRELFFHQSAIQLPGRHELRQGQRVAFEVCKLSALDMNGNARYMALNILPLKEKETQEKSSEISEQK